MEEKGSGEPEEGAGRKDEKDEARDGKVGMGVGLCMEQFMNRTVEGGRGHRWMYSVDGWLNGGGGGE